MVLPFTKQHTLMRFSYFIEHKVCGMLEDLLAVGSQE
jgi:hypothetical protein